LELRSVNAVYVRNAYRYLPSAIYCQTLALHSYIFATDGMGLAVVSLTQSASEENQILTDNV